MKTRDLISILSKDQIVEKSDIAYAASWYVPVSVVALAIICLSTLGVRPDISSPTGLSATAMKLMVTLSMAGSGLFAALQLGRPVEDGRSRLLFLALPFVLLIGALAVHFSEGRFSNLKAEAIGRTGWTCLVTIPALSALPLLAILLAMRKGAPTRLTLLGTIAAVGATGIGASFYALRCVDDSPAFVLLWYGLATLISVPVGIIGARRLLSW